MTGDTLGNGVVETFGYDANRLQLTSQTATKSGNTLMNLTYGYQASAGQMGSGSTAGNAGQLMTISGTIGGSTESAGYSYDNLGRLLTSNQTSNGSSAQRRFAYDRWGNRTAMWDAVSGGNQIQSLALEQSGGVPTNRIQFNLPPGTNVALASNGATATASSSYSGGGSYPASGVINGDRKGVNWGSGGGWNDDTANTYPDWVQVSFNGSKTINEIDVFTLQDNYASPSEPTEAMTFTQYGIVDFKVQYWDGSAWNSVTGGNVTANNKVWRRFTFSSLTTDKIRVRATNALSSYTRLTEIEAYQVVTPAYDAAGNVTNDGAHTYGYDSENRIVSVDGGSTASSAYDNQNRRYKKTVGSTVTHYVWQGSQVLAEHNGSTGAVLIDYVYSGSRMIAKLASGSTQYFLSDRLSVRLSLDSSGNVLGRQSHLPFGEDFGESGTQEKHHFTSYERDEGGTDYGINRQYHPAIGRFNRPDPFGASARMKAPQSWNRYAYVTNNVLDRVDPTGLQQQPRVGEGPGPNACGEMTPGECLCATAPQACYGDHGQLLDGGSGGGEAPESCDIKFFLTGPPVGRWPVADRFPTFDPNVRNHGGGISSDNPTRWFYYFEVFIPIASQDQDGWIFNWSTTASGRFTMDLGDGRTRERRFFQQDPADNPTASNSQWTADGRLWVDAPSFATTQPGPGNARYKVISAKIQFLINITATKGNKSCSKTLFLSLTIDNSQASWFTLETP